MINFMQMNEFIERVSRKTQGGIQQIQIKFGHTKSMFSKECPSLQLV